MARRAAKRSGRMGSGSYWVKSSFSFSNGNCIEVASLNEGAVGIRDSKNADGLVLRFTQPEWRAFLGGVRGGEYGGPPPR